MELTGPDVSPMIGEKRNLFLEKRSSNCCDGMEAIMD